MFSFQLSYLPSAQSSISVSITGIITGIAIAIIGVIIIVFNRHGCLDQFLFDYSGKYGPKPRQLYFLKCVLLSGGSRFRQLTFCYGGRLGNISKTEDIVDRIICFL